MSSIKNANGSYGQEGLSDENYTLVEEYEVQIDFYLIPVFSRQSGASVDKV